jgi:hypothetical protein
VVLALVALVAAGCTTGSGSATNAKIAVPLPAGNSPSPISLMVCSSRATKEIDAALGEKTAVDQTSWVDHRYSCRFAYPAGSMVLSVKELSSWSQTIGYFDSLSTALGTSQTIPGLAQGAFQTTDGSMVVRKDWKVLEVNISGLPAQFGVPATSSGNVALRVAYLIIGCWAGD